MADLSITAASVLASTQAKTNFQWKFGTTVTQGEALYLDTSNLWQKAINTGSTASQTIGIALNAGASGQPAQVVTEDPAFTPGATLTIGESYYLSNTAGKICAVGSVGSAMYPSFLFVAYTAALATLKIVNGTGIKP